MGPPESIPERAHLIIKIGRKRQTVIFLNYARSQDDAEGKKGLPKKLLEIICLRLNPYLSKI